MSNIAGKAYAMNVISPLRPYMTWLNKFLFWAAATIPGVLKGLITLSLIHYARWVIIKRDQFPYLDATQPKEDLSYNYMMFFSNFNGSWDQYVDSFTFSIPGGLDTLWKWTVRYPKSVPLTPFHDYIRYNQVETIHYYNAYPLATSNDIKSAKTVKSSLIKFNQDTQNLSDDKDDVDEFLKSYNKMLRELQHDLGDMHPTPIVSMSAYQVERRQAWHRGEI